jgi:mono/diheme cytochrome c family protein
LDRWNLLASSDEWLSPVFADVGPDGAVWVADWQNFIIQHNPTPSVGRGGYDAQTGVGGAHVNPLRDHERGRIYRVVWEGAKKEAARIDLESAGSAARVAALGHANKFWRDTAQRLLVESRATDAVPTLRETVKAGTSPAAVHALWTLHGLEQLDAETLQGALRSKSPELRRNAIRALPMTVEAIPQIFASGVMTDPDPVTRLAALVYLAQVPKTAELERYASQVRKDRALKGDEWLEEAAMLLFRKHGVSAFVEGENLLPNATFEAVGENQLPLHWTRRDYGGRAANKEAKWSVTTNPKEAREGSRAVRVDAKDEADTSLYADVVIKPDTLYRLTGWVKFAKGRGTVSLNDHLGRHQTSKVTRSGDWQLVETEFRSGKTTKASINLLFVASGTALFDEVKLVELRERDEEQAVAPGDVARGETIFYKHATVACTLCHMLKGQGSAVGPALDGLAAKFDAAYIHESLMNPNAKLAKGYENLGVSPMPPAGLLLKPQELADLEAFLATLK